MKNKMNNFAMKLARFMMGRYGQFGADDFSKFLLILVFSLSIAAVILNKGVLVLLSELILLYNVYRLLSKNIVKRAAENRKYRELTRFFRHTKQAIAHNKNDSTYHYCVCPKCAQTVRVPKGRGKIEIKCPKCGKKFSAKS